MRFYSGFSFKLKWKHLKWLAIPLFAILSYFSGAFGFINTYAYTNMSTKYNVTMPDYETDYKNKTCGNTTLYDFINSFIEAVDWSTSSYQVFITGHYIYFVQTSYVNENQGHKVWVKGSYYTSSVGNYYGFGYTASKSTYPAGSYVFYFENNCQESDLSRVFNYLVDVAQNGNYNVNWSNNFTIGYYNAGSTYYNSVERMTTINNNSSYDVNNWWYYSSYDLYMANSSEAQGNNNYWKTIHINDNNTDYGLEAQLPSYYDLYPPAVEPIEQNDYFIGSNNRLGTLYANLEPNLINNFNIDFSFNTNINYINAYDYYQNIDFTDFNCFARINHNDNYYSYEKFSYCDFELNIDDLDISSSNDLVDFSIENLIIYDSNDNRITDFSNYDKIFVYLHFGYDDESLNKYISNLNFSSAYNMLYTEGLKGEIYDDFDLPSYFKMFLTNTGYSNSMASNISVRSKTSFLSSNNFLYSQPYSTTTLEPTQIYGFISTNFQNLSVNNSQNIGYMIYHQINNLNLNTTPHLDMVLMRDIIVSFRNISSNDFYYSDDTGTITNNNIDVDYSYGVEESFGDITGILPPGPLDSLLNIPFKYLSKIINSLNETCSPLSIPFIFDSELTFPCFDTYYEEFPSSLKLFTEVVPCAFILIFYFKHLYKKIFRATTLETTENDEWGCL